jgi:peptidylprolyl isomerase
MKDEVLIQEKWLDKSANKATVAILVVLVLFGGVAVLINNENGKLNDAEKAANLKNAENIKQISKQAQAPAQNLTQTVPITKVKSTMNNITTLENGLVYEDTVIGTGAEIKSGDRISMHYKGTLVDGTKFDSSYDRGQPFTTVIGVGQVIQGWDQGVPGMKVGGKRKLMIPSDLGYGARGAGGGAIPPNADLIFEVEAVAVL